MIRYVVDAGTPTPIEDARCTDLTALGFHRDGAYRTDSWTGEVWVDEARTTMVAVRRDFGRVLASIHSVLEDGTQVITEEKGPWLVYLVLSPGVKAPIDRTSLRFPDDVAGVKALLAEHRAHLDEIENARGSKARADASVATFVDARNEAMPRLDANLTVFVRVAKTLGGLGFFGCVLIGVLQRLNGRPELMQWVGIGMAVGLVYALVGLLFVGPMLLRRGFLAPVVPKMAEQEAVKRGGSVRSIGSGAGWPLAVFATVAAVGVVVALVKGAASLPVVFAALMARVFAEHAVAAFRDRNGQKSRDVTWEVAGGMLRVEGERPLPLSQVSAAIRAEQGTMSTLVILDRHGRVALRLSGPADALDAIRDAVRPERASFPIVRDLRILNAVLASFLLVPAVFVAVDKADVASTLYGVIASLLALPLLLQLRARKTVELGVDGLVIEGRFVGFADIESIATTDAKLDIVEKAGNRTSLALAHPYSSAEIARRWAEHAERSAGREEAALVRRRVAIDDDAEEDPYRARIASPEELGEALLDSAETRSVRVRAARRLARDDGEDAARVREEVEEQVVDPDVRHALDRPRR